MNRALRWTILIGCGGMGAAVAVALALLATGELGPKKVAEPTILRQPDMPLTGQIDPSAIVRAEATLPVAPLPVAPVPMYIEPLPPTAQQAMVPPVEPSLSPFAQAAKDRTSEILRTAEKKAAEPGIMPGTIAQSQPIFPPAEQLPSGNGKKNEPGSGAKSDKAAKADRNWIRRAPGEGDDHLTIHIQDMDIREVLDLISEQGGTNILASNNVSGKVSASLLDVDIDTALAAILRSTGYSFRRDGKFIYVGTNQDFQNIEQNLDRIGTRIYRPNYVRAADVQHLITPLLTPTIGTVSVSQPSEIGIQADPNKVGGDGFAGSEAVLVKDYEAVLAQIDQIVAEIDKRPLQVQIEAMILSVKLDDEHAMGVDFQLLRNQKNIRLASGSPLTDLGQMSFKDGGLKFGFLDSSLGLFINALESIGDTNVIASPKLLCLNKHRSEVLIGSQLGYVSTTVTETSTSQKVEFLEVGTQLRIRPFISADGLIRMEVHPELSTGSVEIKGSFTLPEKDVTQVTTNIMVRDGCTFLIGGLIRDDLTQSSQQIPLLGNLPWVGPAFRNRKETVTRHEIVVLITPHIVYDDEAAAQGEKVACEYHRQHGVYADEQCPWGKRYIGRKYFRLAQQAWAAGDQQRAMRFANLAIHFDPQSRAAIDLRSDIWQGSHQGDHTGTPTVAPVVHMQPTDGAPVPSWVLDDVEGRPMHPRDPGQPGPAKNITKPRVLQ